MIGFEHGTLALQACLLTTVGLRRQNGDCPMFRRFYVQKVLCSENICSKGSMFRRFYVQKVLCSEGSMFRRLYVQKVLCSEGPMFRKTLFKRSYSQKVLCSEGPIFRYIQKVLYSENYLFYVFWDFSQSLEFENFLFSAIIIIIFARFWNSRISSREIREN